MTNEEHKFTRDVTIAIINQNQLVMQQNSAILERVLNPLHMVVPDPSAGQAMDKPSGHFCAHGKPIEAWCTDCDIGKIMVPGRVPPEEACPHGVRPGGYCAKCYQELGDAAPTKLPGQFCAHGVAFEDDCPACMQAEANPAGQFCSHGIATGSHCGVCDPEYGDDIETVED